MPTSTPLLRVKCRDAWHQAELQRHIIALWCNQQPYWSQLREARERVQSEAPLVGYIVHCLPPTLHALRVPTHQASCNVNCFAS